MKDLHQWCAPVYASLNLAPNAIWGKLLFQLLIPHNPNVSLQIYHALAPPNIVSLAQVDGAASPRSGENLVSELQSAEALWTAREDCQRI